MIDKLKYGYSRDLGKITVQEGVQRITDALKAEGFGILTTIDVQDTFKKKLGDEFRPYVILGACNPQLARRALGADLEVGLLLPCNVTVFQGDAGQAVVQAIQPETMMDLIQKPEIHAVAQEADQRLKRALERA